MYHNLQDMVDCGTLRHDAVPEGILTSNPKMEEFTCNGILKLLQNLKPFKAAGPDKLKPFLLRELRDEIAPIIQIIFERSLQTGKLPADWCKAQVTPIFKKGNKSSAANYRPIIPDLHTLQGPRAYHRFTCGKAPQCT